MKTKFKKNITSLDELILGIETTIQSGQDNLFTDKVDIYNNVSKACIAFLQAQGYSIDAPKDYAFRNKIHKLDDLITLFYDAIEYYNIKLTYRKNILADRHIAKLFVENRMSEAGLDKKTAMEECAEIILTFCKNIESFNFKKDCIDFSVFGQDKNGWITNKVIDILNNKCKERTMLKIDKLGETYSDEATGFDLITILQDLEA